MKTNLGVEKSMAVCVGAFYFDKWRLLLPALAFLTLLMVIDYISGMLASKKEALDYPNEKEYGWSSKKSIKGIYKKVGYIFTIFVAISIDYFIYKFCCEMGIDMLQKTIFGLLITLWLIINELLSILENSGRLGVILPQFLLKILSELRKDIDNNQK